MSKFAPPQPRHLNRSLRPRARTRTVTDIDNYRREVLGLPSLVDRWLSRVVEFQAPSSLSSGDFWATPTPWSKDPFSGDEVECRVWVTKKEGAIEEPFQDDPTYTLNMTVHLHADSGFLIYFQTSPRLVIDKYCGYDGNDMNAPGWVKHPVNDTQSFSQCRAQMLEVVACLALTEDNASRTHKILDWCFRASMIHTILQDSTLHIAIAGSAPHSCTYHPWWVVFHDTALILLSREVWRFCCIC